MNRFEQWYFSTKFKAKRFLEWIFYSDFVGNTIIMLLEIACVVFMLTLWYPLNYRLMFAGAGLYFVANEVLNRINKMFSYLKRSE